MSLTKNHKGYLRVGLVGGDGKRKYYFVHRLVYEAFIGNIPDGLQINHKSEDKLDNRPENLECVTPWENANYGTRNERISKARKGIVKSHGHPKQLILKGVKDCSTYRFVSRKDACKHFGLCSSAINSYIGKAIKKGERFITLGGIDYYYLQSS